MKKMALVILSFSQAIFAVQLSTVKVSGEKEAEIFFQFSSAIDSQPIVRTVENTIELTFSGMRLPEGNQKTELEAPHALIQRITAYALDANTVKARVVLNGSADHLKDRIALENTAKGTRLRVKYPSGSNPTLELLKEEQKPITASLEETKAVSAPLIPLRMIFLLMVLASAGVASYFFVRYVRKAGGKRGPANT